MATPSRFSAFVNYTPGSMSVPQVWWRSSSTRPLSRHSQLYGRMSRNASRIRYPHKTRRCMSTAWTPQWFVAEWSRISFPKTATLLSGTSDLMARLFSEFTFDSEATEVATPLEDVWKNRRGVCQDFAHIAIACLRSLGLPARYVSGYLRTIPPPGQERLQGADASHAWISTYCPVHGWTDFDPTNNLMPSDSHVRVAVGRDYSDVSPLIGVLSGGGSHIVRVEVDVVPHD